VQALESISTRSLNHPGGVVNIIPHTPPQVKKYQEERTMDDREILKTELMKLLDDIPLERLKALYIKALVASSAKVVNPDCRQGTEPREEIIAWIVEQLRKLPLGYLYQGRRFVRGFYESEEMKA